MKGGSDQNMNQIRIRSEYEGTKYPETRISRELRMASGPGPVFYVCCGMLHNQTVLFVDSFHSNVKVLLLFSASCIR